MMLREKGVFVDDTEEITTGDSGTLSQVLIWLEVPHFALVKARQFDTSGDKHTSGSFGDIYEWSLNTVENCFQNT